MCGLQICESGTLAFSTATISAFNLGPSNDMALSQGQFFGTTNVLQWKCTNLLLNYALVEGCEGLVYFKWFLVELTEWA